MLFIDSQRRYHLGAGRPGLPKCDPLARMSRSTRGESNFRSNQLKPAAFDLKARSQLTFTKQRFDPTQRIWD
jgi:hypothetical protein